MHDTNFTLLCFIAMNRLRPSVRPNICNAILQYCDAKYCTKFCCNEPFEAQCLAKRRRLEQFWHGFAISNMSILVCTILINTIINVLHQKVIIVLIIIIIWPYLGLLHLWVKSLRINVLENMRILAPVEVWYLFLVFQDTAVWKRLFCKFKSPIVYFAFLY